MRSARAYLAAIRLIARQGQLLGLDDDAIRELHDLAARIRWTKDLVTELVRELSS